MKTWPPIVLNVMYALSVVMGMKKPNPKEARALVKDTEFISKIKTFDCSDLTHAQHKQLDKYVHHKDFNP